MAIPFLNRAHTFRIEIRDQGIGIPEKHLEGIFDPFYTTEGDGKRLGLSTVRSIIRNHGGIVLVDSKLGSGSTFTVVLTFSKGREPPSLGTKTGERRIARKGRVLVMDDEEPILDVLQIMLEEFGYEVVCVRTGEEAIIAYGDAISNGIPFRVVIMDLTIKGGMGGKMRSRGSWHSTRRPRGRFQWLFQRPHHGQPTPIRFLGCPL